MQKSEPFQEVKVRKMMMKIQVLTIHPETIKMKRSENLKNKQQLILKIVTALVLATRKILKELNAKDLEAVAAEIL